jgi:hypothetical protein
MASFNALGNSLDDGRGDASRYVSVVYRPNDMNAAGIGHFHVEQRADIQLGDNASHRGRQSSFAGQPIAGVTIWPRPTATA